MVVAVEKQTVALERQESSVSAALDQADRGIKSITSRAAQTYLRMYTEGGQLIGNGTTTLATALHGKKDATEAIAELQDHISTRGCRDFNCAKVFIRSLTNVKLRKTNHFFIPVFSLYYCGPLYKGEGPVQQPSSAIGTSSSREARLQSSGS